MTLHIVLATKTGCTGTGISFNLHAAWTISPQHFDKYFFYVYIQKSTKAAATAEALNMEQSTFQTLTNTARHRQEKRHELSTKDKNAGKMASNNYENKLFE